ncbi:MAG TPA: GAF domain-containing protein [Myxococcales bacterium]|nr:GAF domain-containing protein [Myxococcales bacterium]
MESPLQGAAVLVVDPDAASGSLVSRVAEGLGAAASSARTLAEATAQLGARAFAAVVAECELPDGDGAALIDLGRQRGLLSSFVMLSSAPTLNASLALMRAGAVDCWVKPLEAAKVEERLRAVLAGSATASDRARLQLALVQSAACREILRAALDHRPLKEIAERSAAWAMKLLSCEGATFTFRTAEAEIEYLAALGGAAAMKGRKLQVSDSSTGEAMARGAPVVFDPLQAPPASRARAERDGVRSGLIVPLLVRDLPSGTLGVTSSRPQAFTQEHVALLVALAGFIAEALELLVPARS